MTYYGTPLISRHRSQDLRDSKLKMLKRITAFQTKIDIDVEWADILKVGRCKVLFHVVGSFVEVVWTFQFLLFLFGKRKIIPAESQNVYDIPCGVCSSSQRTLTNETIS